MSDYQVLARSFRPQTFQEILNQEAIVQTLKNSIKQGRVAHAYLLSGSKGSGKTTTARILAKALNCPNLSQDQEPCNHCPSCLEISQGNSLEVLEIDGASHRGIEEIRQIKESAPYATSKGGYKIYIIDEVHMLTKEAFNALLKTLEEPSPKVMFILATTESHKIPPTILSRCQRFNFKRIPQDGILFKLRKIKESLGIQINDQALLKIAQLADGGFRDAESLFDQIISFHDGAIDLSSIENMFGMVSQDVFFEIDEAIENAQIAKAFEIPDRLFKEGKDLGYFLEGLIDHYRHLLILKLTEPPFPLVNIDEGTKKKLWDASQKLTREELLTLLDFCLELQQELKNFSSPKIALEALLLKILRIHQRLPLDVIVNRLTNLEKSVRSLPQDMKPLNIATPPKVAREIPPSPPSPSLEPVPKSAPSTPLEPAPKNPPSSPLEPAPVAKDEIHRIVTEDPTPLLEEIPPKPLLKSPPKEEPLQKEKKQKASLSQNEKSQYETKLQFAAVELEGMLKKHQF